MAYGQTMLVLLAILLFSTMMLGYYNNLFRWYDMHNREFSRLQALKLAESVFQEIEFTYIADLVSFSELESAWSDSTRAVPLTDVNYTLNVESSWCDSLGTDTGSASNFLRFDLRISCYPGFGDTIWVGTATDPLQKLIADMGI
ncbi:MAG: hypothetical protein RAO94_09525 [Candidatus Stygibacter australis]|nr:hypothetical protein [Candidatus Stygibacter australis]